MRIEILPVGPLSTNCVVLVGSTGVVLVDPGDEPDRILGALDKTDKPLELILLTHAHVDHARALADIKASFPTVPVALHPDDMPLFASLEQQGLLFGLETVQPPDPDIALSDGMLLEKGGLVLHILHTPGHSPGSVSVWLGNGPIAERTVLVGDLLFKGSVGRTDLPGGSFQQLEQSIREKIYPLGDDVTCICGHGPTTTVGAERRTNPFVRG